MSRLHELLSSGIIGNMCINCASHTSIEWQVGCILVFKIPIIIAVIEKQHFLKPHCSCKYLTSWYHGIWDGMAFNQGSKHCLWGCKNIAGEEVNALNLFLEMQLATLDHFYLELLSLPSFMRCSKLLVHAARQLCKSDWITWFLPLWCCSAVGWLQGVTGILIWHLLLPTKIFPLASAGVGSRNWSHHNINDIILLLLRKKRLRFFSAKTVIQVAEKLAGRTCSSWDYE